MKKLFLLLPLVALLTISSCKKDETEKLTYIIWWDSITASNLRTDGVTSLRIYIDDDLVADESTFYSYSSNIDCDANDAVSKTYTVDKGENELATYRITAQDGYTLDAGTFTVSAKCNLMEFVYN